MVIKMNRVFVSIGPINIYWYSVLIISAILIGIHFSSKVAEKNGLGKTTIIDLIFGLIFIGVVGARLYYVVFNFSIFKDDLISIFKVWEGGLAIYGAVIAGIIYIWYYAKKKNISFIKMLDICSLSLLLGQAIGRWGNFFNSEAYGGITTYSKLKSMHIPPFIIKGMYIDGAYREPTFLYESIWCLIGVLILWYIRKKKIYKMGNQVSFYMIWYGIGRFIIESMRSDSLYLGNFRVSQIVSIILVVLGIIGNFIIYRNNYKKFNKNQTGGIDGRI